METRRRCRGVGHGRQALCGAAILSLLLGIFSGVTAQPPPPAPPAPEPTWPMLFVFRDSESLRQLRVMCAPSELAYQLFAPALKLPEGCHLPNACGYIFSNLPGMTGFSGSFTNTQLRTLERCLPSAIYYREVDQAVHKAEDSPFWHAQAGSVPAGAEQQQQPEGKQPGGRRSLRQAGASTRSVTPAGEEPHLVHSFDEMSKTSDPSDSAPINMADLTGGGGAMSSTGEKDQALGSSKLWNLDRIDQRVLPLNNTYLYGSSTTKGTGQGAHIYVVDSGILASHQEFMRSDGSGSRASYGVAKEAEVVAVRILDCSGSGTISDTVAALDWVAANHIDPAIVTLSLGIQVGSWSRVLEDAVRSLVLDHNITVVVASGNSNVDSCYVAPANVPDVITVAASNVATKYNGTKFGDSEPLYSWSNSGPCVDIFAPGVDIYSACGGALRCAVVDGKSYTYASGTSMAVPHVAGVAAVYLGENPGSTPQQVQAAIIAAATPNMLQTQNFRPGTPNRLLYSRMQGPDSGGLVQALSGPPSSGR